MKIDNAKTRPLTADLEAKKSSSKRLSLLCEGLRSEIVYLEIPLLVPYKYQARRSFNPEELQALADTIKEHGIRQPLTVLKSDIQEGFFEVVSGERRLRAAKLLGLKKVPCIILESRDQAEEIALIENIQRQDLHPIELAKALKTLIDKVGRGAQSGLEKKIGMSQSQISELLKLTELSERVQDHVLHMNYRGRDNLRSLFQFKTEEEQLNYINKETIPETKQVSRKTFSILRLSYDRDYIRVQKQALKKLDPVQKEEVIEILKEILQELE
jgi:ParB family chromosome partitioning protein